MSPASPSSRPRRRRGVRVLVTSAALAGAVLVPVASAAAATDVLFIFDTTGSMGGALDQAKANVNTLTGELTARLGDVRFGVAEVRDYPGLYGDATDYPWKLRTPMTGTVSEVAAGIDPLTADNGGDLPESYGRGLFEAAQGDGIGWRAGARHVVVLIADNVPHDDDLQGGVPQALTDAWFFGTPWNTSVDPGRDGAVGTADDIDWQRQLEANRAQGVPLGMVLFDGSEGYLRYWEHWAGITGGAAVAAETGNVISKMIDVATQAAKVPAPVVARTCGITATYTRRSLRLRAGERITRARLLDGTTTVATFRPNSRRTKITITATGLKDQAYAVKVTAKRRAATRTITRTRKATCA